MPRESALVLFAVDGGRYALPLPIVEGVLRAAEVVPLPGAPDVVLGVIDLHGRMVPVMNIRKRFGWPSREVSPSDQMLIATAGGRRVALLVDSVAGVSDHAADAVTPAEAVVSDLQYVRGVVRIGDDLVLIHDLEKFLSLDEHRHLDIALENNS